MLLGLNKGVGLKKKDVDEWVKVGGFHCLVAKRVEHFYSRDIAIEASP